MKRRQFFRCLTSFVAAGLVAGCNAWKPDTGKPYDGNDATWGKAYRPPAKTREKFFFNEKSQQIEESLGL